MTKVHDYFKAVSYFTMLLVLALVAYFMYLSFYPFNPISIVTPMPVDKAEYRIGDTLKYTINFCKTGDYQIKSIKVYLADGYLYQLPQSNEGKIVAPLGCHKIDNEIPLVVPNTLNTDEKYSIKVVIERKLNIIKSDTVTYETVPFKIKK